MFQISSKITISFSSNNVVINVDQIKNIDQKVTLIRNAKD